MEENQVQAQEAQKVTENAGAQAGQEKPSEDEKRFTQSDVEKLLDSRLKRERETWEKKLTESQKLSKMTAEQKKEYQDKQHAEELEKRETDITRRELHMTAKETLIEKGLPVELSDALAYDSAENCSRSIEAVEKAFRAAVEKAVEERIKKSAKTPKSGESSTVSGVEEKFYALNPQLKH